MSIYGVDIANIISEATSGELTPLTITRAGEYPDGAEYDPVEDRWEDANGDPLSEPEDQEFTGEGIAPAYSSVAGKHRLLGAGLIKEGETPILIIAGSLDTDPKIEDQVTIDSITYTITRIIEKDPAGATWTVAGKPA